MTSITTHSGADAMRKELIADLREVFDASWQETPQIVRDVIEYANSWLSVYIQKGPENATLQAAWRIADEASRELIEGHGMRVDHVTISLDADEIASAPALEEAIDYLENRGLATRMDAPDEVLVIFDSEDE